MNKKLKKLTIAIFCFILIVVYTPYKSNSFISELRAADTGFKVHTTDAAVTSGAGDNNGFEAGLGNSPQDATTANDGWARSVNSGNAFSDTSCSTFPYSGADQHDFYNYSFSVPSGATINGVEVYLEGNALSVGGSASVFCAGMSWDSGTSWTSAQSTGQLSTQPTDANYTLGGSTDTWGRTWSDTDFSNTNFRIRIQPEGGHQNNDFNLDILQVKVYYTEAAAISISLTTNGSVGFGYVPLNTSEDTTASGIDDVETISVDSGPADLDAESTTFSDGGNTWTLSTSNGSNIVKWEFSPDGSSWTTFAAASTLYSLATNVSQSSTQNIYLRITMPTATDSYSQYSSTVTIQASAP